MAGCAPLMKLYCSGMQKPHRKKRFLFVRRTTPRSGGTLRAAFYSACTLILHASHGNVNVHFAQIRPAFRSAVCGTRVRAAGLSAEKTRAGRENGRGGRDFRFGRDGERKACLRTDKGAGELNILCTPSIRPRFPARRRTARAFFLRAGEKKPRLFRVPANRPRFPCAVGPTAFLSYAVGRTYGKTPRGRTLLRRGAFFAGSDLLRLFAEQPSDQRAQQARRTEAVNFQKNQPLPFYVISKRA